MTIIGEERNITLAVDYAREALTKRRINSKAITRAMLSVEELLAVTITHLQKPGGNVTVRVVSLLGTTEVWVVSRGSAFDSAEIRNAGAFRLDEDADEMENAVLASLFERVMGDNLSVRNRNGTNQVVLTVHRSKYRQLILTLTALALGLLAGIVLKSFLPADICAAVSTNVLAPVSTMFLNALKMIVGPLVLFSIATSMSKMVLGMNMKTLLSVFTWIPVCYIGCILMIAFYGLMILVLARLNPLKFFGKYYPVMLTAYTFASSNASLPSSMECCGNSLGISRRLYAFSLPLGATINMDGSCVVLGVSALFMAKIFGIPVTGSLLTTLALSIFVLSIAAPGVPGAALVCLSILLPQIGVPSEAISLIMGLYALVGMILVCTNVTGDAVMTLIVGKQENQVDLKVYNS